jgi:hypothetical protein
MDFVLLLLVTGVMIVRPTDFVPEIGTMPVYQLLIVPSLIVSVGVLLGQLSGPALRERPITVCVLGLMVAVLLSNLANVYFSSVSEQGGEFGKVVLLYLLIAGVVNSRNRLRGLMTCIAMASALETALAVLHYHGMINLPAFDPVGTGFGVDPTMGKTILVRRLCGSGTFHDPNDLSLILSIGVMLSLYALGDRGRGLLRVLWLAPVALFVYALALTHSRGAFLALLGGLLILLVARFGMRRAILLSVAILPAVFALFSGRMTDIGSGTREGTGQLRVQIWMEGLGLFFRSPVFGIGSGKYTELVGKAAHNSFLNAYVELGFFGGVLFLGAFYYAGWRLYRLGRPGAQIANPELRRMRPYLLAALVSYAVGIASMNFTYIVTTYALLGLATAYLHLADPEPPPGVQFDGRLVMRLFAIGTAGLVALYLFATLNVRWG